MKCQYQRLCFHNPVNFPSLILSLREIKKDLDKGEETATAEVDDSDDDDDDDDDDNDKDEDNNGNGGSVLSTKLVTVIYIRR